MVKATAATLDADSPLVVSCHRHPGLASGGADGKTGLELPVSAKVPQAWQAAGGCDWAGGAAFVAGQTLENIAPCTIPTSFAIRTVARLWC